MPDDSSFDPTGFAPKSRSSRPPPGQWQAPTPEELQQEISAYEILDLLGRGGMGAVYKGWQKSLDRHVAIKVLPLQLDEYSDAQFAARFKQEAKTMAKFIHPGIVSVFDAGETPSGMLYIVMEFVEGTDVAAMMKSQGRLASDHALSITSHVCDALHYAHSRDVIHRDIKPANIMVNLEGQVKVADFGLAKAIEVGAHGLTKTSMAMGTPDFMAPECLISDVATDHRADLYSVGVMLYNMLTGEIPRGRFKSASDKSGCDPRFDAIINRAMDQEREVRYQSALEIRRELEVILATMSQSVLKPPLRRSEEKSLVETPDSLGAAVTLPAMAKEAKPEYPAVASGQGRPGGPAQVRYKLWIAVVLALIVAVGMGIFFWLHQ